MQLAILGVYPEGPESTDDHHARGRWSPWRLPSQSPFKLWKDAEPELRRILRRGRPLPLYVYWGGNTQITQMLLVDDLVIGEELVAAPDPTFSMYSETRSRVWLRYAGFQTLKRALRRDDFREVPLVRGRFAAESRPIGELSWVQMHHSGLTFVEVPVGTRPGS